MNVFRARHQHRAGSTCSLSSVITQRPADSQNQMKSVEMGAHIPAREMKSLPKLWFASKVEPEKWSGPSNAIWGALSACPEPAFGTLVAAVSISSGAEPGADPCV